MNITFGNKKLEKLANDDRKCFKEMGRIRAGLYRRRLNQLRYAQTLEDVRNLPGNYHELTGNRKGQWSCDLDQPYRLVFEPHGKPVTVNEHGKHKWFEIKGIEVIEITDYH